MPTFYLTVDRWDTYCTVHCLSHHVIERLFITVLLDKRCMPELLFPSSSKISILKSTFNFEAPSRNILMQETQKTKKMQYLVLKGLVSINDLILLFSGYTCSWMPICLLFQYLATSVGMQGWCILQQDRQKLCAQTKRTNFTCLWWGVPWQISCSHCLVRSFKMPSFIAWL